MSIWIFFIIYFIIINEQLRRKKKLIKLIFINKALPLKIVKKT